MSFSWQLCQQFPAKSPTPPPKKKKTSSSPDVHVGRSAVVRSHFSFQAFRGSVRKAGGVISPRSFYFCLFCFLRYHIKISFRSSCKWNFFFFFCPPSSSPAFSQHEKWQRGGVPPLLTSSHKSRILPPPAGRLTRQSRDPGSRMQRRALGCVQHRPPRAAVDVSTRSCH